MRYSGVQGEWHAAQKVKCHIWQSSVDYLGYHVDAQGIHVAPVKVDAIQRAPAPLNMGELRSFLGMINYYEVCPQSVHTCASPHALLKAGQSWKWDQACEVPIKCWYITISNCTSILLNWSCRLLCPARWDRVPNGICFSNLEAK